MSREVKVLKSPLIGLPTILGVTFIILKLCHVIEWDWVWVLSPFWIPLALVFMMLAVFAAFAIGNVMLEDRQNRRKW